MKELKLWVGRNNGVLLAVAVFALMFSVYISNHPAGFTVDVVTTAANKGVLLALVAMDVTHRCTGPALGVGAFGLICPSVAAGPGLASACGLIRSLSAPECGA